MSIIGSLVALLKADNKDWKKGFEAAGQDVEKLDKKSKGFFKDLKSSFGKSSTLGQSLKLAAGGGAIAGLSLAAKELKEFASKINDIKQQWKEGNASAGDMFETIAGGLPVFGQFYQAGREIREIFTGEREEIERINKLVNEQNAAHAERLRIIKEAADAQKRFAEIIEKGREQAQLDATPEGDDKDRMKLQFDQRGRLKQLKEQFNKDAKADDMNTLQKRYDQIKDSRSDNDVQEKQNILQKLKPLQENYKNLTRQYYEARAQIVADGETKLHGINEQAYQRSHKQLLEQQKLYDEFAEKNREALKRAADHVKEQSLTPMQKYLQEIKELDILFGTKQIDRQTYAAAAGKAFKSLASGSLPSLEYKPPPLEIKRLGAGKVTQEPKILAPLNDLAKTAAAAVEEQRKQGDLTRQKLDQIASGAVQVNF